MPRGSLMTPWRVRAENQLTQRRITLLPAAAKKALLDMKRKAEIARSLHPDAPPRKRRTM